MGMSSWVVMAAAALASVGPTAFGARAKVPEGARAEVYKTVGDVRLPLYVYVPKGHAASDRRAAIVFFFGGGWMGGSVRQFHQHSLYFASRGMVAITASAMRSLISTRPAGIWPRPRRSSRASTSRATTGP